MSYLKIGPMATLIFSGPGRPRLAAAGYSVARGTFCAAAFWVYVGSFESSVRSTIGLNVCRDRRYVAGADPSYWVVYPPRVDWEPPAWESPGDYEVCDVLEWAGASRVDDPYAPAHEAVRAALVKLVRRSWDLWSLQTSGNGRLIAATAASRVDAALRYHHSRAVAKGDHVVVTVEGKEVAAVGGSADERELSHIRERLRQRGWKVYEPR
jgi:hypothetical protein